MCFNAFITPLYLIITAYGNKNGKTLRLPGGKNGINGTQRTEQSEVYGTKKEEKREKRRKLV